MTYVQVATYNLRRSSSVGATVQGPKTYVQDICVRLACYPFATIRRVGNREDLLAGARQCLREKGYGRTTARDIAAAAGVSLAAIGYHFGTKEVLLNTALTEATGAELGDEVERAIAGATATEPRRRLEQTWQHLLESFPEHRRLLAAGLESFGQLEHVPEVRHALADGQRRGIDAIAQIVADRHGYQDESAGAVAAFSYALLNGLIMTWLTDPDTAPDAEQIAEAITVLAARPATDEQVS